MKPIIAVTIGDPAGIRPEVTAKALFRDEVWACCRPLVVGSGLMTGLRGAERRPANRLTWRACWSRRAAGL